MDGIVNFSMRQMVFTSIVAIILGTVMLAYPAGTLALVSGAFWSIQLALTIFIIIYAISEVVRNSKAGHPWAIIFPIVFGLLAIGFIWLFDIGFIYFVIACFFILSGFVEIVGSFMTIFGRFFIFLLGIINVMIGAIIIKHPLILPLLIAWYILFWGISRLLLALELQRLTKNA